MKKGKMLRFIASLLNIKIGNGETRSMITNSRMDWEYFVQIASEHLVIPAAYCRLKERELLQFLPLELVIYLEKITDLNRKRNIALLREAQNINSLFKSNNIHYVFLKGMGLLQGGYYKDISERMIGDIDILIHPKDIIAAQTILLELGYYEAERGNSGPFIEHRHLPRLISDKYIGAVELHKRLVNRKGYSITNPNLFLETKVFKDEIPIPSARNLLRHNIVNIQINDNAILYGAFSLRNAYDSLLIMDKEELNDLFCRNELRSKLAFDSYFYLFDNYFGDTIFNRKSFTSRAIGAFFIYKMNHSKLNGVYVFCVNALRFLWVFINRLKLFLRNREYRNKMFFKELNVFSFLGNLWLLTKTN